VHARTEWGGVFKSARPRREPV